MKIRLGHVSNSSSSSFIISKKDLTVSQFDKLKDHSNVADEEFKEQGSWYCSEWIISEKKNFICGHTIMDNFDMSKFLRLIGVDSDKVLWDNE